MSTWSFPHVPNPFAGLALGPKARARKNAKNNERRRLIKARRRRDKNARRK